VDEAISAIRLVIERGEYGVERKSRERGVNGREKVRCKIETKSL